MIQVRRAIGILTSIVVVCASAVVLQTRAADEGHPDTGRIRAVGVGGQPDAGGTGASRVGGQPKAGGIGESQVSVRPGAPQVPEESATIRDDPTIAPDPKQSADNNVSFPNDI